MTQQQSIAGAIIIGFAFVAAAIYFSGGITLTAFSGLGSGANNGVSEPTRTTDRRVFGDPKAPITIIEFSDVECPFCARLHPTLEQLVLQSEGQVQWEYRHLPLPTHRNAELGAAATECVGHLTDNDTFWSYLDTILKNQRGHSEAYYLAEATALGIDEADFQACITSEPVAAQIAADTATAQQLGGRGTPFSVIQFADGSIKPVSGALPFAQWQALLNS